MKKLRIATIFLSLILLLAGCRGHADRVKIIPWEPSGIYSDEDIRDACEATKQYFRQHFSGCVLRELSYAGDNWADEFTIRAAQYGGDEAIILISSFYVMPWGGDGSLNRNFTYTNWQWILIRNENGKWIHADHGY